MTRLLVLLALCLSTLAGCRRQEDSAATDAQLTPEQAAQIESEYILPTDQTGTTTTPVAATPSQDRVAHRTQQAQPVVTIQQRLQGAIHAQLTIQLRRFIEKYGRMPESFSEFVNATMDTVPEAPAGMKFAIDPVDKSVKAVKK